MVEASQIPYPILSYTQLSGMIHVISRYRIVSQEGLGLDCHHVHDIPSSTIVLFVFITFITVRNINYIIFFRVKIKLLRSSEIWNASLSYRESIVYVTAEGRAQNNIDNYHQSFVY